MKNHFNSFLSDTIRLRILLVYLFLFLFCSCKTSNRNSLTTYHPFGNELSSQLENSPSSISHYSKTANSSTLASNSNIPSNPYARPIKARHANKVSVKEKNSNINKKIKYAETKNIELKHKKQTPSKDFPFNFDKYSNAFWQIGGVLFLIGLFLFWLCFLALLQSYNRSAAILWVAGLLLGLAFLILSLPFILIGAIIGNANKVNRL